MQRLDQQSRHRGERGFTLVELLIVMIIVAILISVASIAMRSSKISTRMSSMRTAAATIDEAVSAFNRIYPPVGGTDPLLTRNAGAVWSGIGGDPSLGLADETGEWLMSEWPTSPYGGGGVRVYRATSPACTRAGAVPGDVLVCRTDPAKRARYAVVGWGQHRSGATVEVYRVVH